MRRDDSGIVRRDNPPTGTDRRLGGGIGRDRGGLYPGTGSSDRRQGQIGARDPARSDRFTRERPGGLRHDDAFSIFTRSREGREFRNGIALRHGGYISDYRIRHYFSDSWSYYPWYYPTYDAAIVYYSPYSFYFGVCAPYIYRQHTWYRPPTYVYIEVPVYVGNECRGYDGDGDDYYLSRDQYSDEVDGTLRDAIDDIRSAFTYGEIERLVYLTEPQSRIAVYLRGRYEYSLDANDYLDMTRDAMRNMDTVSFDLSRARRRSSDTYVVSGRHVYNDGDGRRRTVYVSFVLERLGGRWAITQVGTAPDRL